MSGLESDAIGKTIHKIGNAQKRTAPEHRADKVIFVITTDGMENASSEYSFEKIKALVERRKEKYGWEFIFLGANIDAIATARHIGIGRDRAANYHSDSAGTQLNYEVLSDAICMMRAARRFPYPFSFRFLKSMETKRKH